MGLVAVLAAATVPPLLAGIDRSRTHAAARFIASRMAGARMHAVARGAAVGLRFATSGAIVSVTTYVDGNGNGLRTSEMASGVDRLLDGPMRLDELFPGVAFALEGSDDATQFGVSDILSFTPSGTATSGSAYLRGRDGAQFAVRVFGATARTRILRYDPARGEFVETL